MYENNATTNAILVILLVLVVGFIVWFMTTRDSVPAETGSNAPSINVDLGGSDSGTGTNQ